MSDRIDASNTTSRTLVPEGTPQRQRRRSASERRATLIDHVERGAERLLNEVRGSGPTLTDDQKVRHMARVSLLVALTARESDDLWDTDPPSE